MAKRRGNQEGSITQLSDGRWQARITYYENGIPKRKAFYGKTRKEAQEKLQRALADLQRGILPVSEKQTVGEFLVFWLEEVAKPRIRPRTYELYRGMVHQHLIPAIGHLPLVKLAPAHLNKLRNEKVASGLSASTVRCILRVASSALSEAEKWQLVPRNVAKLVDAPRVENREVQPFTVEELVKLLDVARGHRLYALFVLAVALGLRQGELLGLRWQDVDFERGTLTVAVQLQTIDGKQVLVEPKTARSRRTLQLPQFVLDVLQQHLANQLLEKAQSGESWREHGLVFASSVGTPVPARNLLRVWYSLLRKAGLPKRPFHTLRHTAASYLLAMGCDLRTVQQVLGHSQVGLTANLYTHVMPTLLQDAAQKMDALFRRLLEG
ncbi:MAG: site-specific integrase [Armatimonadota bacterium]|nr:MAG: site-specific integrase [Armatimonadota bacterium]